MLRISIEELYRQEIEHYTHKLSSGDLTPLIYDMLKETSDLKGLLEYLGYIEEEKNKTNNVVAQQSKTFTELFKQSVEVI